MGLDGLSAARGLLAFLAFAEATTAGRCLLSAKLLPAADANFVRAKLFPGADLSADGAAERLVSHCHGLLCLARVISTGFALKGLLLRMPTVRTRFARPAAPVFSPGSIPPAMVFYRWPGEFQQRWKLCRSI